MLGIAVVVVADGQGRCLARLKAEINVEDTEKTSEEQACTDEQDAGQRDFTDDEKRAESMKVLAFGGAAAGTGKASAQICGGDEKAGREAEEGCSDGGDERGPKKRGAVNFHGAEKGKGERGLPGDEADDAVSENETEQRSGSGKNNAFREELADDA